MKIKYRNRLRKSFIMFLSFFISIGSFIGLFVVNAIQASAYGVINTGQLKLASGVCYNGRNPDHPFIYTTERMTINANTYLPTYQRGNDGAGGSIGGTSEILLKRINTSLIYILAKTTKTVDKKYNFIYHINKLENIF